jgi:ankyrin repeat protein
MGWSPLLWAASQKDLTMVKYLHENGAALLQPKKDGFTSLHVASSHNDVHVLDYVIKKKETPSIDLVNEEVINIYKYNIYIYLGLDSSTFSSIYGKF